MRCLMEGRALQNFQLKVCTCEKDILLVLLSIPDTAVPPLNMG